MFEPADRLGGVLRTEQVGGQPIDVGAEAFVARRPEVPALLAELGLADRQIGTTGVRPLIYSQGRLHELPRDTLNGIPTDPSSMTGLVDDATIQRMLDEPVAAADLAAGRGSRGRRTRRRPVRRAGGDPLRRPPAGRRVRRVGRHHRTAVGRPDAGRRCWTAARGA